jgi:hypothetical protein
MVYAVRESSDEAPERKTLVSCDRYFRAGVFVLAPTAGHFNGFHDLYKDAEQQVKKYLEGANSRAAARRTDNPREVPTLLPRIVLPPAQFVLKHLTEEKLLRLIALDDETWTSRWVQRKDELEPPYQQSSSLANGQRCLEALTPDEQDEYMRLVELGRKDMTPREFAATAGERSATYQSLYLAGKLGNGYLRSALSQFGVSHLAGQPLPPAPLANPQP